MKKYLILVAAVMLAAGLASSSWAACGAADNRTFGQLGYGCPGNTWCFVTSPASPGDVEYAPPEGDFWAYTAGDPTVGSGHDNGLFEPDETSSDGKEQWCRLYSVPGVGHGCYMTSTWGVTEDIDGCIAGQGDPEVMIATFSDSDGTDSYWAAAAKAKQGATDEFLFELLGSDIALVPVPAVSITGTQRDPDGTSDPNTVEITVATPDMSTGCYTDGTIACADFVDFRVYKQVVGRGAGAPGDLAIGGWTPAADAGVTTFRETCATDSDIYLAIAPVFDSGFTGDFVGVVSTVIQCGTTIADPEKPGRRFRIIDRNGGKGAKKK